MSRRSEWGSRANQKRCEALRTVLRDAEPPLCSADELAAYWPGGAENHVRDPQGRWVYCYAQYSSFLRRGEKFDAASEAETEAAKQAALDAFRDKPINVELVQRADDGRPRTVAVYPKSFDTLSLIDEIDGNIRWAYAEIEKLGQQWNGANALRLSDLSREATELHLTQCWILTHPGCGAPFDPAQDMPPLPASQRIYEPLDVINVLRAHHNLHRTRIDLICRWLRTSVTSGEESGASWTTVASAAAKGQQAPVEHLLRSRSFPAWLAQSMVAWKGESDAAEKAKQRMAAHPKGHARAATEAI